jgi:predicted anti-sigma-YlaC factor YlaD
VISCEEAVRRLWAHLEKELHDAASHRIEEHLALCRRCCGEAEFVDELRAMLRRTAPPPMPVEVEQGLLAVLTELDKEPS